MPAGDVWGNSWGDSWNSYWAQATVAPVVEQAEPGAGKKRGRKYPRWVLIDGTRCKVANAAEERQLLQAHLDRVRLAASTAQALEDETLTEQVKRKAMRVERRIEAVDSREDEWRARLLREDEELLVMLQ